VDHYKLWLQQMMTDSSSVLCLHFTDTISKLAPSFEFLLLLSLKNYAKLDLLKGL